MRAAVVVFHGSNCDRDMAVALKAAGADVSMVWHKDASLPDNVDLVAVPGGFSFGDYLRCGAIAAQSPICKAVVNHAERGGYVLGVCNGFQVFENLYRLSVKRLGYHLHCFWVQRDLARQVNRVVDFYCLRVCTNSSWGFFSRDDLFSAHCWVP